MTRIIRKPLCLIVLIVLFPFFLYIPVGSLRAIAASPLLNAVQSDDAAARAYRYIDRVSPVDRQKLSARERQFLYDYVALNEVTRISELKKYDPQGIMGFCFGRAMAVHLKARRMGLSTEGIRKLFIIGKLGAGGVMEWRFHVAALVRGDDSEWYAIEFNIAGEPCTLKEWVEKMRMRWDMERKAKFYAVSPEAVIPRLENFPDEDKEKGEQLIELTFNPRKRKGFVPLMEAGSTIYWLDNQRAREYFSCAGIGEREDFDFQKVKINGEAYDYREYFDDLLKFIKNQRCDRIRPQDRGSGR